MVSIPRVSRLTSLVLLAGSVLLFVLGGLLDIFTTLTIIDTPGFREANPIVAEVVTLGGGALFGVTKLCIGALLYVLFRRPTTNRYLIASFATVGGLWFVGGVWNAYLLLSQT